MAHASGAVLLSKKFFDGLPAEQQKTLLEVSARHLRRLNLLSREENDKALQFLQKEQGLKLYGSMDAATLKLYEDLGKKARRELAGKLYSPELLDRVEKSLAEFRGKTKKS